ncbi:right-handed parallel beta-helix repeat-containing protein [Blastococcus sp. SYSU D00813]
MAYEPGRRPVSRRAVLGTGVALVLGTAAACSASGDDPSPPRRTDAATTSPPPPPATPSGEPLLSGVPVVDVRALGAVGDGRADDTDAVRRGLDQVNAGGGTLYFPAGQYLYRGGALQPAAGVTLAGVPGASTVLFDSPGSSGFVSLLSVETAGVTVDGLVLRRAGAFRAVLVDIGGVAGFRLSRSVLDGAVPDFPGPECHGIKFPDRGAAQDVVISGSTLRGLVYGLLMANASTATVTGVTVEESTFTGNANTDLEFNSPSGWIRRIRVDGCTFADNDSEGFGVGLAHVEDAVVSNCSFDTYSLEAVHVEDYSDEVTVRRNTFRACGLRMHSHVQVISGCTNVRVVENTFDATANAELIYVVNALPGGTQPTAGGRPSDGPSDVLVRGNTFDCSADAVPVYFQDVERGEISGNTITAQAADDPSEAFRLLEDPGTTVTGNAINGRTY